MKKFIEFEAEYGKIVRIVYEGTRENAEKFAFSISNIWKSKSTKLIIKENGAENTALEIIRK